MEPPPNEAFEYPLGAPSLLGSPYIAAHGTNRVVVGATQRHRATVAEALAACGPVGSTVAPGSECWGDATEALVPAAAQIWPPIAEWKVTGVNTGMRALPDRMPQGSVPYAGRLPVERTNGRSWWLVCGLGARGLVYHAWLGRLVAFAMARRSEEELPPELLRWRG